LPPWDQCLLGPYSGNDGCKPAPGSLKVACRSSKAIDNHRHPISSGPVQAGALSSADHPPPQQARMQGNTRCQMQHQTHTACRVQWRGSGSAQQTRQPKPPRWDCMACCTPAEATTLSRVGVVSPCHASCHASGLSDGPRSAQVARRARNVGGYMATPSPGVARNSGPCPTPLRCTRESQGADGWLQLAIMQKAGRCRRSQQGKTKEVLYMAVHLHSRRRLHLHPSTSTASSASTTPTSQYLIHAHHRSSAANRHRHTREHTPLGRVGQASIPSIHRRQMLSCNGSLAPPSTPPALAPAEQAHLITFPSHSQ